jgi:hypothetical protein
MELDWSLKFQQDPFMSSKVIPLFNLDRCTDAHLPIHIWMEPTFNALFDTFQFTTIASLTQFVKDYLKKFITCVNEKKFIAWGNIHNNYYDNLKIILKVGVP